MKFENNFFYKLVKSRIGFALMICLAAGMAKAVDVAPVDVKDLVGARGAGGEFQLQKRGYVYVKTVTEKARKLSTWWKPSTSTCIAVSTQNGHYASIVTVPESKCAHPVATAPGQGKAQPVIQLDKYNEAEARFTNGCLVNFNVLGKRIKNSAICTPAMLQLADNRMAAYRKSKGMAPAGSAPVTQGDFADSLAGGPDYWKITGLKQGEALSVLNNPGNGNAVVSKLPSGAIVKNMGCKLEAGVRWCQVADASRDGLKGWVQGQYLRESGPPKK